MVMELNEEASVNMINTTSKLESLIMLPGRERFLSYCNTVDLGEDRLVGSSMTDMELEEGEVILSLDRPTLGIGGRMLKLGLQV